MRKEKKTLVISDNTEIYYPESEREALTKCASLSGFQKELTKHTGVTHPTLKTVLEEWRGRKRVIDLIRTFVPEFIEAMESPLKSAS